MLHKHRLGVVLIDWPYIFRHEGAPDVLLGLRGLRVVFVVRSHPVLGPEGSISICLRMLEEESLITELARVEVGNQLNGRDRYPFATFSTRRRSQGIHGKQLSTSLDGFELVIPGACSPILEHHALVRLVCLKRKLIGDRDISVAN